MNAVTKQIAQAFLACKVRPTQAEKDFAVILKKAVKADRELTAEEEGDLFRAVHRSRAQLDKDFLRDVFQPWFEGHDL